jgi:hypothetical protein
VVSNGLSNFGFFRMLTGFQKALLNIKNYNNDILTWPPKPFLKVGQWAYAHFSNGVRDVSNNP